MCVPSISFKDAANIYVADRCSICLIKFRDSAKIVERACGHIFHEGCLATGSCALCQTPLEATLRLYNGYYADRLQKLTAETKDINFQEQYPDLHAVYRVYCCVYAALSTIAEVL